MYSILTRLSHGAENGPGQPVPAYGGTAPHIVDAVCVPVLQKMNRHRGGVLDVDEIAQLLAVAVLRAIGLEQAQRARC